MAKDHRLNEQPFTCANRRFQTDISKGNPHGENRARGSVFDAPLVQADGHTLWLEYATDSNGGWGRFG